MKKKIVSSLLAAGLVLSTAQADGYATGSFPNEPVMTDLTDENTNKIGFESSLRVIGQTDNSISIKWDKPEQASVYSVFVNGNVVAEKIESTQYNIDELKSANEYFISVSAFDENGKLLLESNEICAHTNLTVNSNYTLTKDIKAANIFINGGTFNLNGYTLTVDGDVWLSNGYLNVNNGKLYVGGDLNVSSTNKNYGFGYLTMQNDEDYILVNGNMYAYPVYNYSSLTAGTIELKGDFAQKYYPGSHQNNFYCSGSHKVILSGEKLQTVSFASTQSQFNVLDVQNFSEDGVVFSTAATVVELLDNGCNVSFANGERSGWTLEDDEVIDGDLNLSRGTLDLNGHKLTVTGNLVQSGGNVLVNGGELEVQGDYRVQALNGGTYTTSSGTLTMKNDSDAVKVGGDFVMQSTKSHSGLLSAGVLEISGNLTQLSGGSYYNFCTTDTHTIVLNGSKGQTISIANNDKNYSRIANLKIENTSAEGVNIATRVYIFDKLYNTDSVVTGSSNLYITATTEFPDSRWNYDANFVENRTVPANLSIGGSAYINASLTLASNTAVENGLNVNSNLNLNGYTLTVDGDVWLSNGYLNVNKGKLYVGGDLNVSSTNKNYGFGYLTMQNDEDYILVNGNMYAYPVYNYSSLTAGTIELKGDFAQKYYPGSHQNNFYCSGSHKVILSGEKLQTVSFASTQSQFNVLDVQNFSEDGVVFSTAATVVELLDNGCNVSFANGERSGWTLEDDEVIDGDLNLSRGTLDLNGHKLTVTGNLVQSGGNVLVNGGELEVQGDYRVQALNGGTYTTSSGTLTMKNDSDAVKVGGDFVMQSTKSHSGLLSAGVLEISGNLTQLSGGSYYNFCTTDTHTIVLNGSKGQTISIANNDKNYSRIANLKIENTSAEGVNIATRVYIFDKLYNTDSVVTGSSNLYITATTEFPDSRWNYDANFVENRTVPANLSIGGSAYINASLTLASNTAVENGLNVNSNLNLNGYTLTVDGDVWLSNGYLNVNKGKLYVGGDLNVSSTNKNYGFGYLTMQNDEDYILVNGNMYAYPVYNYSSLTAGTIELKGDFAQKYYPGSHQNNFYCSGSHKVILSGEKLQTVSFASTQSQFNVLDVQNFSEDGVVFSTAATVVELLDNGCNVSFANGERSGWTLEDDEVIDGDLNLSRGTLDLNGHKLTVTGNLVQSGGNVLVNGGELEVQGDYRVQALNGGTYTTSSGTLTMKNDSDAVKVGGDFVMQSTKSHSGLLSAGVLEISGNLTQLSGGSYYNFCTTDTHTIVLNGSKGQTISIANNDKNYSRIANLKIENTSAEGVNIATRVYIFDKLYNTDSVVTGSSNLYITATTEFPDSRWNYDANFVENRTVPANLSIGGSAYINASLTLASNTAVENGLNVNSNLNLNGYTLTVDGDVWLSNGYLNVNKGKLYVGGDLNVSSTNKNYGFGYLTMQNDEDYILVNGNMYAYPVYNYSSLTAGTIELKGDFAQKYYPGSHQNNFYCSGSHKVILSGEKLQTVSFASTQSQFNVLDVQNFSEDGVVFSTAATVVELLDNGCNVSFANGERSGWTLEDDEVIDGDLNLSRGTLDLNGHKLTVTGNLVQSGGNVLVNGGELEVQGDYRVQALNGGTYTTSSGTLTMKNDSDAVKVGGDFVMQSTKSHSGLLSAGVLEISGNLTQLSGSSYYNFCTTDTHTIVLNGSKGQTISIANNDKNYSRIANLKIENTSAEGVNIATRVYIFDKLYNTDSVVTGSSNLYITATTEFPDSRWNYDANFVENRTVPANLSIGGSAYINASLTLASNTAVENGLNVNSNLNLNGYTLTVDGDVWLSNGYLNVNKGKLYVGGDLNVSSTNKNYGFGYLTMQNDEDYILVNGNMYAYPVYNYSSLTAGTIELKGDFAQKYYPGSHQNNFYCSGSHKVILSGEKLQTVSFASTQSQFNVLEITKPFDIGYVFNDNANWNELVENYTDDSAPAAPTNLQFVRSTSTSIMMRWTNSADIGKLNCYEVYRNGKLVGTTKSVEFIDNGLNTHTQYEYYIVALGANGVRSEKSNTSKAATDVDAYAPTTPTGLQAVVRADGTVYLTWIASSDNVSVDGYNLYRNGEFIGNTVGTTYNDKNAEPGYHEYYVEAYDNEGNNSLFSSSVYADNMPPEKPVLHISAITTMQISFKWDAEDNVGIDHFEIYKNGEFFKNTTSNEYTDTSVAAGNEYSYYVVAIDTSGNISEESDMKKVFAKNDEEKPQIVIANQTLSENSKSLRIVCTDDVMLATLKAEIKAPSSNEWRSVKTQLLSQKSQIVNLDLSDYLTDSGEYNIKINVADAAGNTETVESGFTYAKNEMTQFEVTATADGCSIRLDWTSASDNSNVYYEIRRINPDGTEKYITTVGSDKTYYIDSGLYPLSTYGYFVIAHDNNLYTSKSNTINVVSGKDTIAPTASLQGDSISIEGYSLSFDGSLSKDNFQIKSYKWDFGDGSKAEGKSATHAFANEGEYTVTLIVEDESGNTASDKMTVTVYNKNYSVTEILVIDESGRPISNPAAYVEASGTASNLFYGNKDGILLIIAENGTYDFSFFANEYMPLKQSFTINGMSIDNARKNISLTKSELVSADFNVKELDINEIEDLGIDVTAPENQYVSKVEIRIRNNNGGSGTDEDLGNFSVCVDNDGEIIQIEHNGNFIAPVKGVLNVVSTSNDSSVKTSTSISSLGGGINNKASDKKTKQAETVYRLINGTMVSLSVTEYSWLKDFYEVSISFTNNAGAGFDIINPKATLILPDGLSLANNVTGKSMTQTMNTINGGSTETVSWIIKGESHGTYNISVDFEGVLSPFGIPVEATFTNGNPITVTGGDALKLTLTAHQYYADLTLTNVSDKDVNNVIIDIDKYAELNDASTIIVKYPSGLIEKIEWEDEQHTTLKRTVYLPVNMTSDADIFSLRTLKPGESIKGQLRYKNREIDD